MADIRYNNSSEYEEAVKRVAEITEKSFIGDTVATATVVSERPAMEHSERNFELLEKINKIFEEIQSPR